MQLYAEVAGLSGADPSKFPSCRGNSGIAAVDAFETKVWSIGVVIGD